ncbi:MAG: rhodanese-like domain-containing protein [Porticoccus sp.]|nr:rhodanese-like domain-containing protein [Porticoccus sp.]
MFLRVLFFSLLLIAASAFASQEDNPLLDIKSKIRVEYPTIKYVSIEQLREKLSATSRQFPLLLDVREPEEYSVSQIHGAKLTPTIERVMAVLDKQEKNRIAILYCSVGYRSALLAKQLQDRGYKHIYNLEGSIFEWANNGYPVYQGDKQVFTVHPYNFWWGRLLDEKLHFDY